MWGGLREEGLGVGIGVWGKEVEVGEVMVVRGGEGMGREGEVWRRG